MSRTQVILVLAGAAVLEALGDTIVRIALHQRSPFMRLACFAAAAAVLFSYGWTVNAPAWDFGKLLGVYIVFFFIIAQLISWLYFKKPVTIPAMIAGALFVTGGIVFAFDGR